MVKQTLQRKRATIIDVAQLAGVSRQTVSRVLNDSEQVLPSTRRRVLQAIEELNYRRDSLARSLVTRRTYTLGLLFNHLGHINARIIEGAEARAQQNGYQLFISSYQHSRYDEPLDSPLLSSQRIEGLLIVYHGADKDEYQILETLDPQLPTVTIGYASNQPSVSAITIKNYEASYRASSYLIERGHTRIAHITGRQHYLNAIERRRGYCQALLDAGLEIRKELIMEGAWNTSSGYEATHRLLEGDSSFTAIVCQNDWMAIGCLRALREHQLRVPRDIALIGFDDIPPARYVEPPLSTLKYDGFRLGELCAKLLIARIQAEDPAVMQLSQEDQASIEPELIIRESSG